MVRFGERVGHPELFKKKVVERADGQKCQDVGWIIVEGMYWEEKEEKRNCRMCRMEKKT